MVNIRTTDVTGVLELWDKMVTIFTGYLTIIRPSFYLQSVIWFMQHTVIMSRSV